MSEPQRRWVSVAVDAELGLDAATTARPGARRALDEKLLAALAAAAADLSRRGRKGIRAPLARRPPVLLPPGAA